MEYSKELKEMIYTEYPDFTQCIQALECGSLLLGRYLCDSIPSRVERKKLSGDALNLDILTQVTKIWRREDIYTKWRQERDNESNSNSNYSREYITP